MEKTIVIHLISSQVPLHFYHIKKNDIRFGSDSIYFYDANQNRKEFFTHNIAGYEIRD